MKTTACIKEILSLPENAALITTWLAKNKKGTRTRLARDVCKQLGLCARRVAQDFHARYGVEPWLMETFKDVYLYSLVQNLHARMGLGKAQGVESLALETGLANCFSTRGNARCYSY